MFWKKLYKTGGSKCMTAVTVYQQKMLADVQVPQDYCLPPTIRMKDLSWVSRDQKKMSGPQALSGQQPLRTDSQ